MNIIARTTLINHKTQLKLEALSEFREIFNLKKNLVFYFHIMSYNQVNYTTIYYILKLLYNWHERVIKN